MHIIRVLMITPRVDPEEDVFGFIYYWVKELGSRVDRLVVLTVRSGSREHLSKLPPNTVVYEIGDRRGISRLIYAAKTIVRAILKERIDVVFTHMYVEFALFATPIARIFRKPVVMFYAHGAVDFKLRVAALLVDRVATSSEKGFRINTSKRVIVGQGIDVEKFRGASNPDGKTVLYVGRISPVKNIDVLIKAAGMIGDREVEVVIVGKPYEKDSGYMEFIKEEIKRQGLEGRVKLVGDVPHERVVEYYRRATVFVNPSATGSLDKTVLEAMACEVPVVTCNEAFYDIFDDEMREKCMFAPGDYEELAGKIEHFITHEERALKKRLRRIVEEGHSIGKLADNLVEVFRSVVRRG